MGTTESLSRNRLYDPIRRVWVAATPEEQVRQGLLRHMIDDLAYPPELISVERALSELVPERSDVPERRIDIVAFRREGEQLRPLLLVECKAVALTDAVLHQVLGYNHFLGARLVAVANGEKIRLPWGEQELDYLPAYVDLSGWNDGAGGAGGEGGGG